MQRPLVARAGGEVRERTGREELGGAAFVVEDVQQLVHASNLANSVRRPPYGDLAMQQGTWTIRPCPHGEASALAAALGISWITASVLVRRGYADVEEARRFVRGEIEPHDPFLLGDMAVAVERIRAAIAAGKRICVHGDYDVDGICATSLAVLTLRELGADVDWHLPSRFEEGYGVSGDTISRLADEGCALLLTVDCGITAVEEVAAAKARGLEVIVTDHHRPGDVLPDCPIVGDPPLRLPLPGALRHRRRLQARAGARRRRGAVSRPRRAGDDRRRRAAPGREPLARDRGPARARAHAAARAAGADAERPRRSRRCRRRRRRLPARAADQRGRPPRPPGRRARAAAHDDADEAKRLADELETLNRDRQAVEERILRAAVAEVESWPEAKRRRRGYVIWGEDWHEGVIGIVASRLVERFNRPVVLIAGGDGDWKGSGRSLPAFDLHGALGACAQHLKRFGGHRAAAGLSIDPANLEAFAAAFAAHADACLADEDLAPVTRSTRSCPARR